MKVREVMSPDPLCCVPSDTVQRAAIIMRDGNIGSLPVVDDEYSRQLIGIVTDRDLCCSVLADGLDSKTTRIEKFITRTPVSCREGENIEECERAMQEHQLRRIPVVDANGRCIGIVAQADLALKDHPVRFSKTVIEISKPRRRAMVS
jgi:CBS domain-containing protein